MLKQLRLKFVCITMAIVTLMLCVMLGMVIHFTARNLEQQSIQALYSLATGPMGRPGEQKLQPGFAIQVGPGGTLLVRGGELFDLSDQAYLRELLAEVSQSPENPGVLPDYGLRFYRSPDPRGETIHFVDISGDRQILRNLAVTCVAVGLASFVLLLGLSFLLARWAIRPVEKAWQEQRQFVADASHELKTPLTVILTNAELLAGEPQGIRTASFSAVSRPWPGRCGDWWRACWSWPEWTMGR